MRPGRGVTGFKIYKVQKQNTYAGGNIGAGRCYLHL
jgi:hypothetical protein